MKLAGPIGGLEQNIVDDGYPGLALLQLGVLAAVDQLLVQTTGQHIHNILGWNNVSADEIVSFADYATMATAYIYVVYQAAKK